VRNNGGGQQMSQKHLNLFLTLQLTQVLRLFSLLRQAAAEISLPSPPARSLVPSPPLATPVAGGRGTSFLCSIVRVRACILWCVIGLVGAELGQIILSQLHYHTSGDLHIDVSELMAIVCLSAWSSHCSLDLARSISRRVAGVHHYPWWR
jgi:uncharacterized membrane protein YeaQ/YmgE (transglycosylase-associated protein family)